MRTARSWRERGMARGSASRARARRRGHLAACAPSALCMARAAEEERRRLHAGEERGTDAGRSHPLLAQAADAARAREQANATKLVYNRVHKCGSTTMTNLLFALAGLNKFHVQAVHNYFPGPVRYAADLDRLAAYPKAAYVNHAGFLGDERYQVGHAWINLIREPAALASSLYYYKMPQRTSTPPTDCNCPWLEFDTCVKTMARNNCTFPGILLPLPNGQPREARFQRTFFCPASKPDCPLKESIANAKSYALVGTLEELPLLILGLERKLPRFFAGAWRVYEQLLHEQLARSNVTPRRVDPRTNRTLAMAGSISSEARRLLLRHWPGFAEEVVFHHLMSVRFWTEVVGLGITRETQRVRETAFDKLAGYY